jgi:hypothetical protein
MSSHAAAAGGEDGAAAAAAADAHRRASIFMAALMSCASFDRHTLQVGWPRGRGGHSDPVFSDVPLCLSVRSSDRIAVTCCAVLGYAAPALQWWQCICTGSVWQDVQLVASAHTAGTPPPSHPVCV